MSQAQQSSQYRPEPMKPAAIFREVLTARSVARLLLSRPVRYSDRARGESVLTLPGFGSGDGAMLTVRRRLRLAGFKTHKWGLGFNRGNVPELLPRVVDRVTEIYETTGQPVRMVGWSLGGYLAREAAREVPDKVAHIVTLASPIRGGPKYTVTADYYRRQGADLDELETIIADRDSRPLRVPVTCVYSKADGIVDWRAVIDDSNPHATNVEVGCSHLAMGFDPDILHIMTSSLLASLDTTS